MTLREMKIGDRGIIRIINGEEEFSKLESLGLREGVQIVKAVMGGGIEDHC